jgi:uncharacterized protein YndB with AHSA1/START domain
MPEDLGDDGPATDEAADASAGPADVGPADAGQGAGRGAGVELADAGPVIVATVRLEGCDAGRALSAFTDPAVLARWWRGELTADLAPGGQYSVSFPAIGARLAGQVLRYESGRLLEFSWGWDGEDGPPSTVVVRAEPGAAAGSAVLTIEHGPHDDDEAGRIAHQEHWDGWEFFLPALPDVL